MHKTLFTIISILLLLGCAKQQAVPAKDNGYNPYVQQNSGTATVHETADVVHTTTGAIRDVRNLLRGW